MRPVQTFAVHLRLPDPLRALHDLAMNLRWSWDPPTQALFRSIDPDAWAAVGGDPLRLLAAIGHERLADLAADGDFLASVASEEARLRSYLEDDRWYQARSPGAGQAHPARPPGAGPGSDIRSVAYFSPEFGISEALPQYSGGLGVLAGDHLKAASDLGVPIVGIGLFYRQGYFRQELSVEGWQEQRYTPLDPELLALEAREETISVELPEGPLQAGVWRARVGRVPLYLLDGGDITDRLYGGDTEHRLRQEILLGIGGVRALEAIGLTPQVFHTNEGHAGFLALERIRRLVAADGLSFRQAIEAVRAGTVFTTHTPVPAGIDRFPRPLMERYFSSLAAEIGVPFAELMGLGQEPGGDADAPFNMAVMGLRLAGFANGVSKLHGEVSRQMFAGLWPDVPVEEVPIGSVTNGVHAPTWVSAEMSALSARGGAVPDVPGADIETGDIGDDELWRARNLARRRLVSFVRGRVRHRDRAWSQDLLDPDALTIGFARRFATYKRATLLLSQPARLTKLLLSSDRPVQLVFAGKAHPADQNGKEMIRDVVQFARRPELRHRVAFVEDYDMAVGRALAQGSDLWLNNPRRPLEASGTSGEKAALNGALNFSVLDGWWSECFDGRNGWAIPSAEEHEDLAQRDAAEADVLFDVLERDIVPLFYERDELGVPAAWLDRVKASLRSLGPFVNAARMVSDYVGQIYEPAAARGDALGADAYARARAVAAWKARVEPAWDGVRLVSVDRDSTPSDAGNPRRVKAVVELGELAPDDVGVQLVHGPVDASGDLVGPTTVPMRGTEPDGHGRCHYEAAFIPDRAGPWGLTVRVVPRHPDLRTFAELGRVTWA